MSDKIKLEFDHLAVAGETLEAAQAHVEEALGVPMQPGGHHDVFFTHNALLGLAGGVYLEAIAIDPQAGVPDRARWFDLDRFSGSPRLTNWICRTPDLNSALHAMGPGLGTPVDLRRDALRWRMAVPSSGILPFDDAAPALIQWQSGGHPCAHLNPSGLRLRRLVLAHPEAADLRDLMAPLLTDARVVFEQGPRGNIAEFDTPHGLRRLEG